MQASSSKGFSVVEILVATGIMAVVMSVMMTMQNSMFQEARATGEVLAALSLQETVIKALADGRVCTTMLTSPVQSFPTGNPNAKINLNMIPIGPGSPLPAAQVGTKASPVSNTLLVQEIFVSNFIVDPTNPGQYKANLHVSFNGPPALVRSLKDIQIPLILSVTPSGGSASVLNCFANLGIGQPNYLAVWSTTTTLKSSTIYQDPGTGNVGINTTAPSVALEINGGIRVGNSGVACTAALEGSQRYNTAIHSFEFCGYDGAAYNWISMAAASSPAGTMCGNYDNDHAAGDTINQILCKGMNIKNGNCPAGYTYMQYFQADSNYGYTCVKN